MRAFYFNFRCFVRNILTIYDSNELVCLTAQSLKKGEMFFGPRSTPCFPEHIKVYEKKYANLLKPWLAVKLKPLKVNYSCFVLPNCKGWAISVGSSSYVIEIKASFNIGLYSSM